MPQLSRPFQIVMVVFVLFAGVWLFVLQGHSTSNSGSTPAVSSTTAATTGTANTHGSASSSSATTGAKSHGSGSSLGSLGHAIAKAHHAAAVSQQNANQLEAKSAAQSNEAAPAKSTAIHAPSKASTHKSSAAAKPAAKPSTSTGKSPTQKSSGPAGSASSKLIPSGQRSVEADLARGNVVVLLFWNPAGTDDALTFLALQPLAKAPKVSVQAAPASAVANYGSITRGVQVYATPTMLVINKQGQAIVLTGLQDTFAIAQAIGEAQGS
jgi:hypothetical protein